ncbi:MAG TPA: hypothetical protein DCX01_06995 [Bacteroidetes bacterium]|jgi:hypothetical protein|nr:hypothetical protein [Bacteroidota bacterium]
MTKVIKTQLRIVIFGILALLFGFMCLSTIEKSIVNEEPLDIPCQNLDVLDSVDDILHWEILNDTLHIYTKRDSVRDEYERYMYIKNLENDNN